MARSIVGQVNYTEVGENDVRVTRYPTVVVLDVSCAVSLTFDLQSWESFRSAIAKIPAVELPNG